jgi:hypothetical protein
VLDVVVSSLRRDEESLTDRFRRQPASGEPEHFDLTGGQAALVKGLARFAAGWLSLARGLDYGVSRPWLQYPP